MSNARLRYPSGPLDDRFWSRVNKDGPAHPTLGTACWLWTAGKTGDGYGQVSIGGSPFRAHRLTYQLKFGPVPDGLDLDHLCRVRHCVNPDHMEPVTNKVNTLRGGSFAALNARKASCDRGHPFVPGSYRHQGGRRMCRKCDAIRQAEHKARKLAAAATGGAS